MRPHATPIPAIRATDGQPPDQTRRHAAVAAFPQPADPVRIAQAELPRTATSKVQRQALADRLRRQPAAPQNAQQA
ncbi:hypothetical protein [Streptomyces sp. NPDC029674]|uniref:hypothetical protein n=1 Tax=Streptomyces sp. NPDC029674 TaxID=3365297 RepID=UPI00384F8C7B